MRLAYGYNRDPKDFDASEPDDVFIDYEGTNRAERIELFRDGMRPGDTLLLIKITDLGRGGEVPMLEAKLKEMGVNVEFVPYEEPPPLKRGPRSNFEPTSEQEKALKKLWHNAVYTGPYVQKRVCKYAEWAPDKQNLSRARNWLNNRFGPRVKK